MDPGVHVLLAVQFAVTLVNRRVGVNNILRACSAFISVWIAILAEATAFAVLFHPKATRAPKWGELTSGLAKAALAMLVLVPLCGVVVGLAANHLQARRWRRLGIASATVGVVWCSVAATLKWFGGPEYSIFTAVTEALYLLVVISPALIVGVIVVESWTRPGSISGAPPIMVMIVSGLSAVVIVMAVAVTYSSSR